MRADDDSVAIAGAKAWGSARLARRARPIGSGPPRNHAGRISDWSVPGTQTSGVDVGLWATTHHDRLVVMMLLNTAGVLLWFIFGAAVWTYLRDRLPARSTLPTCFGASFIACVTLLLGGSPHSISCSTDSTALRRRHCSTTSPSDCWQCREFPLPCPWSSFAVAVYVHRVLPRYTAHLAIVAAAIHLLLLGAFVVHEGPLSLQGFSTTSGIPFFLFAWILGTALAMPRERQRQPCP